MQLLYILPRPTQCLPRLRWASLLGPTLKMLFARSKSEKSEIPPPCAKSTQNVGYRQFLGTHNGPVNLNQSADRVGHPNINHVRGHVPRVGLPTTGANPRVLRAGAEVALKKTLRSSPANRSPTTRNT